LIARTRAAEQKGRRYRMAMYGIGGTLAAATLLAIIDVRGVLLVDAATFLVSAALLAFLPTLAPVPSEEGDRFSFLSDAKAGLGYIWSVPLVRIIGLGYFTVVAFNGIDDVALVFLAKDSLHGGDAAAGILYAAVGAGLLVGYALLARYARRCSTILLLLLGFGVSSVGNLLSGLAWAISVAFFLQTIRGMGISTMDVATNTLIQRLIPPGMRGRVFAILYGAIGIAAGLSYALGGLLLKLSSPRLTFVVAGAGGLLASLTFALALSRAMMSRPSQANSARQTDRDEVSYR
jgi:Na+/melibiose symporter-like transporter